MNSDKRMIKVARLIASEMFHDLTIIDYACMSDTDVDTLYNSMVTYRMFAHKYIPKDWWEVM